ncbi:ExbD/TolR family protein [Hyphococcus luteus]|uniref:Biopolymer transporter ExbD n=1 Tax=Hyphococcus luteus TaxID=2058213 RepID=A0A2S7K002_9PROT|nr:biopolymer transporter ExbD [Marinicaulis flavus]PQA85834.1 biopolymer transporter ExbD [Marinicaulis flavus]
MARRNISQTAEDDEDVNVTPLLDIVFIMLIFFIVTSTFVKEPGVEIDRPGAVSASERKLASIIVAISDEDEIWINKERVELEEVKTVVEQLRRENPKGTAVVQADEESKTRLLVEVVNQIRATGVTDVAVSTEDV